MRTITLAEHERLYRWDKSGDPPESHPWKVLPARLYRRLQRFDVQLQRRHKAVFEWHADYVKAQQWVGVVQLEGLRIEILPKIDAVRNERQGLSTDIQSTQARENLLTMLQIAGDVPLRSRDMADLTRSKAPLSEHLIATFASQLQEELLKGPIRNYVRSEDNLGLMRGKLQMATHLKRNHSRRDRFYCEYDEFTENNLLNQVFKFSCALLLGMTRRKGVQHNLQHCLLILDDVIDIKVTVQQLDSIKFTRQNDRFKRLFAFCRLVIEDFAPSISSGQHACFSMLFDMNEVFERFIAAFMHKHIPPQFESLAVIPQAKHRKTHLLQHGGKGRLLLKPDILIEQYNKPALIIDTKWKALTTGTKTGRGGTGREDLYQMHAYSQRFGVAHSILLYPWLPGEQPREFDVIDESGLPSNKTISIRYVNISRTFDKAGLLSLKEELSALVAELLPDAPDALPTGVAHVG
jgi:5-methylcytosine-specific restriction enzyme subunit McrC